MYWHVSWWWKACSIWTNHESFNWLIFRNGFQYFTRVGGKDGGGFQGVQFEKAAELRNTLEAVQVLLKGANAWICSGKCKHWDGGPDECGERKIFFIKRNTVFLRKRINLNAISVKEIIGGIESVLPEVLKSPSSPSPLKQEEIDEAAIIYAYLQKNNHSFVLIPDEWLFEKQGMEKLEQPIRELFRHVF